MEKSRPALFAPIGVISKEKQAVRLHQHAAIISQQIALLTLQTIISRSLQAILHQTTPIDIYQIIPITQQTVSIGQELLTNKISWNGALKQTVKAVTSLATDAPTLIFINITISRPDIFL